MPLGPSPREIFNRGRGSPGSGPRGERVESTCSRGNQHAVDLLALGARLRGHEVSTENTSSSVLDVLQPFCEHHTMATRLRDGALSAAPCMDLRLDHKPTGPRLLLEFHGHGVGLFWGGGHMAFLNGYTVLLEDGLALEFVEVHGWGVLVVTESAPQS